MKRAIESHLLDWKNKENRLPLIIQGARQVGKTYIMKWLGQHHFSQFAYFNFDERPELREFFQRNKSAGRILSSLSLISGMQIDENTLLILDEIQEAPEVLSALKYFAESKPNIPVICAGSLLGIFLHQGHSFPVGKVEFLSLFPMTFREVIPYWDSKAAQMLQQLNTIEPIPDYFYNDLIDHFKKYLITGGMPAVVNNFNTNHNFENLDSLLENLLLSFKGDFAKHPVMTNIAKIGLVFDSLPSQLARENRKFVYQLVRTGARARDYEDAIQWLINSGLVYQVYRNTKPALPLSAYDDLNAFKLYMLDVGLLRRMAKLSHAAYAEGNRLFTEFKGAMMESYILQSLVAQFDTLPRYWTSGNAAEVDFILQFQNDLIPIEVKSEANIKSRSLNLFQQKFKPRLRIRYSLKNLQYRDGLVNIPHFLSDYTNEIIKMTGETGKIKS